MHLRIVKITSSHYHTFTFLDSENSDEQPSTSQASGNQTPMDNPYEPPKTYVVATDDESSQDSEIPIAEVHNI